MRREEQHHAVRQLRDAQKQIDSVRQAIARAVSPLAERMNKDLATAVKHLNNVVNALCSPQAVQDLAQAQARADEDDRQRRLERRQRPPGLPAGPNRAVFSGQESDVSGGGG